MLIGFGALVVVVGVSITMVLFPRGLRGPETVAQNFFYALLQAPDDAARLRAAAHLDESDDPQTLVEGLSTRIALDFLRTRVVQGAAYNVDVADSRRSAAERYYVVLRVVERAGDDASLTRRFAVTLQKAENGDWRIATLTLIE